MKRKWWHCKILLVLISCYATAAAQPYVSRVWQSDNGNGTYKNPVLHADYSDPDAIRVGEDFYMVSSSFSDIPGLPILHSKDLVNWTIRGYALQHLKPTEVFQQPQHGNGVWAPSIRYHNNTFYIYYPDPDHGIFLLRSKSIDGPWEEPILVEAGKGLIDPCPLWDANGKTYLVHAYAGSRAGIKSIIVVKPMNTEGTKVTGSGMIVYDGHELDPTIEGPKFYKRNGYYYIFAPSGGVATGWQTVLRSKNVYGPYERKVVLQQGTTRINGPHQGAWVSTSAGEDWFLHFQDKEAYGRVVHLQPMVWKNDWPVIGNDLDGDGIGEPVLNFRKPSVNKIYPIQTPAESDEFNTVAPAFQWQWHANPQAFWSFLTGSHLRLYAVQSKETARNLWDVPNLYLQKFPGESFTVETKVSFHPRTESERAGLLIMGADYAYLGFKRVNSKLLLTYNTCLHAEKGTAEKEIVVDSTVQSELYLRVKVSAGAICQFSFSYDGKNYSSAGDPFTAKPGKWIGAKFGLFCTRSIRTNDAGWLSADWVRVLP